jgi:hypothetical protein
MFATSRRFVRRLLSSFTLTDRLFSLRAEYPPKPRVRRTRLELQALEDRIVPDGNTVALTWVADAYEPDAAGTFRITRTGDQAALDDPLTVTLQLHGTATRGADYQFAGETGTEQTLTVTFDGGQTSRDVSVAPLDDVLREGWESVSAELVVDPGYTIAGQNFASVQIEDDEWWLEATEEMLTGRDLTFELNGDVPAGATIEWDSNYDGVTFDPDPGSGGTSFTTSFSSSGSRSLAIRHTAEVGPALIIEMEIEVEDAPPEVTVPDDFSVTAGETRTLQVTATSGLGIASVEWWVSYDGGDYELDGTMTSLTPSYEFTDYGDYDFWVLVTDTAGNEGEGFFRVTADNVAPDGGVSYVNESGQVGGVVKEGEGAVFTITDLGEELDLENIDDLSVWVDWYGTDEFDLVHQGPIEDYEWVYDPETVSLTFGGFYDDGVAAGSYETRIRIEDNWGPSPSTRSTCR